MDSEKKDEGLATAQVCDSQSLDGQSLANTDKQTSQALLCLAFALLYLNYKGTEEVKTFHHTNRAKKMEVGGVLPSRNLVSPVLACNGSDCYLAGYDRKLPKLVLELTLSHAR